MTGDRLIDREAMGALKARLRNHPAEQATRADIVRVYRSLGHLDQAGRFAIGLDAGARPDELSAYADMVRGLGAGEERVRRLSLLPADRELPGEVRNAIEAGPPMDDWRPWGVVVSLAWGAVVVAGLVTMIVVYGSAMLGAEDVRPIARAGTLITWSAVVLSVVLTTLWCASSSKWRAALVWAAVSALVGICFAGGVIAFSR